MTEELIELLNYLERASASPEELKAASELQSQSDRIAVLEGENADLVHDLERQMTIANIECNEAKSYKKALTEIAQLGDGRKLNWGDAQDAIDIARASLIKEGRDASR